MSTSDRPPLVTPSSYGAPGSGPGVGVDPDVDPEAESAGEDDDPDHREEQG